jgi:formylglycine-generating enzyme required for sulfatase activity
MSSQRISILGTESVGKTVFLAALTHALSSTANYPRITAANILTKRYTAGIMDALEIGRWPPSTVVGLRQDLRWHWHDRDHDPHELQTFDCAGQDFRAIFESEADTDLSPQQLALKKAIFQSDLVLLLFNFQKALDIHNIPATHSKRIDIEEVPAISIRKLRAAEVTVYAVFTQADRYRQRIAAEWNGDYAAAFRDVLPQLYNTLSETGTPYSVVSCVATETRANERGQNELLPVKTKHGTDTTLNDIIGSVENFFVAAKRREREQIAAQQRAQQKAAEKAAAEATKAAEAKRQQQRAAQQELEKRRKRKQLAMRRLALGVIIVTAILAVGAFFAWIQKTEHRAAERQKRGEFQKENVGTPLSVRCSDSVSLELLPVAAGFFQMGSENGDLHERPVHRVTISEPFWLGKTEVTQAQWEAVMGSNPSRFKGANRPVEEISWDDAVAFCEMLNKRERAASRLPAGYTYALPTEAQWEFACRAGSTGDYAGSGKLEDMGWFEGNSSGKTHDVAQKLPNAWGFYDMHGNVWEWCSDWYDNYPSGGATDPVGAASGSRRVYRGGCWFNIVRGCRSTSRSKDRPHGRIEFLGFRLALTPVR